MELNQPVFRAPSIPKLSRRNISSSVISGAPKVGGLKLKKSVFSFVKPKVKPIDAEKLSAKPESVEGTLEETNRILVEIQKQLALDFATRITEQRQRISSTRSKAEKEKLSLKEKAIESAKSFGKTLGKTFDRIISPAKSIFSRIFQFFQIILTGILANNAFKWLQNPANREKLTKFLYFIADHWKWIVGTLVVGKFLPLIIKILGVAGKLAQLVKWLWKNFPKFGGGPKGGGPPSGGGPKGGGPGGGCGPVLSCIKDISGAAAEKLAEALKKTKVFSPLFFPTPTGQPSRRPVRQPTRPKPGPTGSPLGPITLPNPFGLPNWANYTAYGLAGAGLIAGGIALAPALGVGGGGSAAVGGGAGTAGGATALTRILSRTGTIAKTAPEEGITLSRSQMTRSLMRDKNLNALRGEDLARQIATRTRQISKTTGRNRIDLRRMFNDPNTPYVDKVAAGRLLKKFGESVPDVEPQSMGLSSPLTSPLKRSMGGTVEGKGSGSVDSVPAMLAPGEEVVRTSMARLFRPLLKDINDNGGRMWQTFTGAVNSLNNTNKDSKSNSINLSKILGKFGDIVSRDKRRLEKKANPKVISSGTPASTTLNPQKFAQTGGYGKYAAPQSQQQSSSSSPASPNYGGGQGGFSPPSLQSFIPKRESISEKLMVQHHVRSSPSTTRLIAAQTKSVPNVRRSSNPKNSFVSLPLPPIDLRNKNQTGSLPDLGGETATEIPVIAPFDLSNSYNYTTPLDLGVLMG